MLGCWAGDLGRSVTGGGNAQWTPTDRGALLRQPCGLVTACPHASTQSLSGHLPSFLIKVLPEEGWLGGCMYTFVCSTLPWAVPQGDPDGFFHAK